MINQKVIDIVFLLLMAALPAIAVEAPSTETVETLSREEAEALTRKDLATPLEDSLSAAVPQQSYVNITFDVHGLDQSINHLQQASLNLATRIEQIDADPENMTPEQIQALSELTREASGLVSKLQQTMDQVVPTVDLLRDPTKKLVADAMNTVQQTAVQPAIDSVDNTVTKWLVITYLFLFVLFVVIGYALYLSSKQIRAMAQTLKAITEDYEIVRRKKPETSIEEPLPQETLTEEASCEGTPSDEALSDKAPEQSPPTTNDSN